MEDPRPGAVHYIDHYAVPTNELLRWQQFMQNALGGTYYYTHGLVTREEARGARPRSFFWVGAHEIGGFLQDRPLPDPASIGQGLPRYGFWVRREDLDAHRRRLDTLKPEASARTHTIDFYARFAGIEPVRSSDIPSDTVALHLAGGGRMVFKSVNAVGPRTGGHETWAGQHAALTVREDEWDLVLRLELSKLATGVHP